MPFVRMTSDTTNPPRRKGKLYDVPAPENWHLVRDRLAEHEYVPEAKRAALTASEPKKPKAKK